MNDRFADALHEELTTQIPLLLVYLAALAMSAALWPAHRAVCSLVFVAFVIKLVTQFAATYLMVAAQHHWRNAVAALGGAMFLFSAQCAAYLLHGIADAVLLLAVFKGREPPAEPRREPPPEPVDTEPPPVPVVPPPPPQTGIQTRRW
jgi:outer membrane biosynthesis protein TonB